MATLQWIGTNSSLTGSYPLSYNFNDPITFEPPKPMVSDLSVKTFGGTLYKRFGVYSAGVQVELTFSIMTDTMFDNLDTLRTSYTPPLYWSYDDKSSILNVVIRSLTGEKIQFASYRRNVKLTLELL